MSKANVERLIDGFRDEMLSMIGECHMLQQHLPAIGRAELEMAGTRISIGVSQCHATLVAVGRVSMGRRPQPDFSTTAEPVIEFKSYDDVLSIRARGRDPASDQRDR